MASTAPAVQIQTRVAMEAIIGYKTIQEIAADHAKSLVECSAPSGAIRSS